MFAVLHIADFALHAVLRNEPASAQCAAALFSGSQKKSTLLAANALARAAGVEIGMTAPQAVARCPHLIIRSPNADAEAEASAALTAVGFTLSPTIERTAPGICTADLRANRTSPEPHVTAALAQLNALGLRAAGGIGRTPLLALYAARTADRPAKLPASTPRHPAASEREMLPLGFVAEAAQPYTTHTERVLRIADEPAFLAPLPLAVAEPSLELHAVFATWGLRTLGDLTALPRDEIIRRFGAEGLALWQRATGGEPRPLRPVVPAQTFSAAMEFEHEIETLEPLLFVLRRFLDRLALELSASQHVAAELHLTLRLEDDTRYERGFRLPEPTAEPEILFRALHTHLESVQTAASIAAVALRLTPARPLVRQQGLFETGLRDPHGFAETLARIAALIGSDRIGTPQLEDTHRPDAAKLIPAPAVVPPPAAVPIHPPLSPPLRRFRPPLPARVEFTKGCPTYLWTERVHGAIAAQSAAFHSSGDWWQHDRSWSRTEWDITLAEGGLYRLLFTNNAWFIEGEYD